MAALGKKFIGCFGILFLFTAAPALAGMEHIGVRPLASNVIVPQSRRTAFAPDRGGAIEITDISVLIDILESTATTTIEIRLQNTSNRRQEAELIVPVPDGAVIRGFAYDGPGGMITAELLEKEEARQQDRFMTLPFVCTETMYSLFIGVTSTTCPPTMVNRLSYIAIVMAAPVC